MVNHTCSVVREHVEGQEHVEEYHVQDLASVLGTTLQHRMRTLGQPMHAGTPLRTRISKFPNFSTIIQ